MRTILIALCLLVITGCVPKNKKQNAAVISSKGVASGDVFVIGEGSVPGREPIGTKDAGTITQGEVVEMSFGIKNERTLPLVIFSANASCGCTSVAYDKEPVKKGETRNINVTYDSKGKEGQQMVFVNLLTDDGEYTIKINLFVKK